MSKYEYPRLSRNEVAAILAQFQIANVSVQDLSHPNWELVLDLYTRILIHLDFLEDNEQLDFAALEQFENPELHVDSVRIMKLHNRIKDVVALVECPKKFTLRDLLAPDADRTELFISAILNFCLHREAKMNSITEIVDEVNLFEEKQQELETKILQLSSEITECNEARERELPLVQEVDEKVKKLRQSIAALNNKQVSLRTSYQKLDKKIGEMDEKISSAEFTLIQSVQENANLRSKIVQSPDKLQRALEEKKSAREEAKNAERSAMQTFHEKTAIVEVYSKVFKKMSKHFDQMQAIQEQADSAKSIEKELKALKAKLSDEGVLDKSLDVKLVERQGKAEQLEELRKQLEKERNIKCEEATNDLNGVKLEVESIRHSLEAREKNVEAMVAEVDAMNLKIISVNESTAAKQEQFFRQGEEILKQLRQYSSSIADILPAIESE